MAPLPPNSPSSPCSFFPLCLSASPKMWSLPWLSGRVHAEVGGNSPGLFTNCCGEKRLVSDHQDVIHARLPCVRNECTMCNKHFCVLSWSGHDILKPRAVPALLLQRQIVHEEFPGEAPNILPQSQGQALCHNFGLPSAQPWGNPTKSCLRHQISSAIGFHRELLQRLRFTRRNI